MTGARTALAAAAVLAVPFAAAGLEPRFDHRDTHGPLVEAVVAYDTLSRAGVPTVSSWRPAVRGAWGFDVSGVGDELILGAAATLRSFDDPAKEHVLLAADLRYRGYFGTEELKTFFDVGAWVPIRSRFAAGPLAGLGVVYDLSHYTGIYLNVTFATAFGEARIASFTGGLGANFRFDIR